MEDEELKKLVLEGKIFIYPTDTIYGLGCNALDSRAVAKIKDIKKRDADKPLSVIAPSIAWINENCVVEPGLDLDKYFPGPYTVILKKKDGGFLDWVSSGDTIGVRIPSSDFCDKIREIGVPFVTTSVNLSGMKQIVKVEEVSDDIREKVDVIIDEGELNGRASTLVIEGMEIRR